MGRCAKCGGPQSQEFVEITTAGDAVRQWWPGRWDACEACGWAGQPVDFRKAPALGPFHGPAVPTPWELLVLAGVPVTEARHILGIPEPAFDDDEYDPDDGDW